VLEHLDPEEHPSVLVGRSTFDDAGVFRLDEERALIQTVDFFTPVVDDPWTFGAISAANSLSDVYAMGGRPLTALAVAGVPQDFDLDALARIFTGGQSRLQEAGVALVGGHTVKDPELKYGLSVTGIVHPERVVTNAAALPGDLIYLTKPLGTGVITTSLKNESCPEEILVGAVETMMRLNAAAAEAMVEVGAHACTDITGYGFLGHVHQMAHASGVSIEVDLTAVPLLNGARQAVEDGHIAGGLNANRSYLAEWVRDDSGDDAGANLLYDPQTSGGLLISVAPERASALADALAGRGEPVHPVGRVIEGPAGMVLIRP
jgi:selenide,water dikinase